MLYAEGLHEIDRRRFGRRAMSELSALGQGSLRGLVTPVRLKISIDHRTDLPTLVRRARLSTAELATST
jgi:hypothetical protein